MAVQIPESLLDFFRSLSPKERNGIDEWLDSTPDVVGELREHTFVEEMHPQKPVKHIVGMGYGDCLETGFPISPFPDSPRK